MCTCGEADCKEKVCSGPNNQLTTQSDASMPHKKSPDPWEDPDYNYFTEFSSEKL